MCYSGVIGGIKDLPSWMFHAQFPPPLLKYNAEVPGYTWVDLVFPAFLFSMGCAMPFALSRRLDKGLGVFPAIMGALWRMVMLVFFAVYVQNLAPYHIQMPPSDSTWLFSFFGFVALFPVFALLPKSWPQKTQWAVRSGGVFLALVMMIIAVIYRTAGYDLGNVGMFNYFLQNWSAVFGAMIKKSDIIIIVLSNMAFFAASIWILTRGNLLHRIGCLVFVYALWRVEPVGGTWTDPFLSSKFSLGFMELDLGWFYRFDYLKYLLVVVPGTMIGECLLKWIGNKNVEASGHSACRKKLMVVSLFCVALVIGCMTLLQARTILLPLGNIEWSCLNATPYFCLLMIGGIYAILPKKSTTDGALLHQLVGWGAFWLFLGLVLEPLKGGIKKDPSDLTYYFVSTGLSIYLLVFFFIWVDVFKVKPVFNMLVLNGQNPLLAYFGIRNLLAPILMVGLIWMPTGNGSFEILSINDVVVGFIRDTQSENVPWMLAGWGFVKTLLLAIAVAELTKRKVIWKS